MKTSLHRLGGLRGIFLRSELNVASLVCCAPQFAFMACNSHRIYISFVSSLCTWTSPCGFPKRYPTTFLFRSSSAHTSLKFTPRSISGLSATRSFNLDDVTQISLPESFSDDTSDLKGYFDSVKICNRGSETQSEFLPFVVENQIVGYVHNGFANHLKRFGDVFIFPEDSSTGFGFHVTLNSSLRTPEERTCAVGDVVKCLGDLIPGIRNELYPVTSSFGASVFFSLERAAAPYFGIKAYGVHMNGYVDKDGEKFLWIGKRSQVKPTYPGMLDHLVAGGLPHGIPCGENLMKECEEEAGIPRYVSKEAIPVGAISYMDIEGYRYKRDVLFCYDLKLPESFMPENQDGEVEGFKLIPLTEVANIIRRTQLFKPNCSLVIIDFLFRHGYIKPEYFGYLDLLQSLRRGNFS